MTSHSDSEEKVICNQGLSLENGVFQLETIIVECVEYYKYLGRFSPFALIQNLVSSIYGFSGESVETGEDPVPGLAGEVPGGHHAPVVLPDGFV